MIQLGLEGNGYFAVPGGYPLRMSPLLDVVANGVLPSAYSTVTVSAVADSTATLSLFILLPPSLSGSSDCQTIATSSFSLSSLPGTYSISVPATVPQSNGSQGPGVYDFQGPGNGNKILIAAQGLQSALATSLFPWLDGSLIGYQIAMYNDLDSNGNQIWHTIKTVGTDSSVFANCVSIVCQDVPSSLLTNGPYWLRPPTAKTPCYVFKMAVSQLVNRTPDNVIRQTGAGYTASQNPGIPPGVTISSVVAS